MARLAPGGPFDAEKSVTPEVLAKLNERYKLDDPLHKQYWDYLSNLVQGDLGPSFNYPSRNVSEMIISAFPVTFELACYALFIALALGVPLGTLAAFKSNSWLDYLPMSLAMLGICIPSFVIAPILVLIFSIHLQWLPVSGWGDMAGDKILPSISLGAAYAAYIARLSRAGVIEILSQDFIRTAKAKGVHTLFIATKHALRGGLAPVISFLGPAAAGLLAGSFVVESIFQIPGLGRFYVQAAFNRDYTMILGTTIFFASLIVLFNMLTDILLIYLDPKLRPDNA